ncbi:DUF1501 domain-containing protein [Roseimaritima ulvae]|uniref:DUF1501 domain-containing protein n=1 Tax=Roseimaritima ulvae TaxID=980254 RepID=A0A5B9QR78_9BACT|nr:DUF1501 domain-containing protein [Roseimaritima ulvae]QEG40160.1 hypothetical protein UC8_21660 [Roseimaritima ulvae]
MLPKYVSDRRGFLRIGAAGVVGCSLPNLPATAAEGKQLAGKGRAKSVLLVMLSGGPSQLDMWDPKPNAPEEVRGEFSATSTAIPGVAICEHMPKLAQQAQRWAMVRTLAHKEHNHLLATHVALTGRPTPVPRGGSDLDRVESRSDFPNFASALDFIKPPTDGIPTAVSLPNYFIEGPLTWPGQHAGFLGAKHDPWQINGNPNNAAFRMQALAMREGVTRDRLQTRRQLLDTFNRSDVRSNGPVSAFHDQQQAAFDLLTSGNVVDAFEMAKETDETRERYGRNQFGQSLLLAKRLIEAGVPVVQAAMGIVQTWDTHTDNWGKLKNRLLPQLDQGLAALMDDLEASGRLEETMVVVMGEFGRTPKVSTLPGQTIPGRDHWAHAYSGLFAGAGIAGGQVIGQTDHQAAYPVTRCWSPADVLTTMLSGLGVDQDVAIYDPLQRPHHLLNGNVIAPLYTGTSA